MNYECNLNISVCIFLHKKLIEYPDATCTSDQCVNTERQTTQLLICESIIAIFFKVL